MSTLTRWFRALFASRSPKARALAALGALPVHWTPTRVQLRADNRTRRMIR